MQIAHEAHANSEKSLTSNRILLWSFSGAKEKLQSVKVNHLTWNAPYRRKSSFIEGEIPPINTASSLPSAGRSNIFITMLRKEESNRNTFY
jgi:hypothetical protein